MTHPNPIEEASWTEPVRFACAWKSIPREGETACGDAVVVRRTNDAIIVCVIDVLGHGPKAEEVATKTTSYVVDPASPSRVLPLVHGIHALLKDSRGAAALVLSLTKTEIEVASVGNVALRSTSGKVPFVLTPGVLGVRLREARVNSTKLFQDRIALFTDGISGRFDLVALRTKSPKEAVASVFASNRHAHDDATAVVIDISE